MEKAKIWEFLDPSYLVELLKCCGSEAKCHHQVIWFSENATIKALSKTSKIDLKQKQLASRNRFENGYCLTLNADDPRGRELALVPISESFVYTTFMCYFTYSSILVNFTNWALCFLFCALFTSLFVIFFTPNFCLGIILFPPEIFFFFLKSTLQKLLTEDLLVIIVLGFFSQLKLCEFHPHIFKDSFPGLSMIFSPSFLLVSQLWG